MEMQFDKNTTVKARWEFFRDMGGVKVPDDRAMEVIRKTFYAGFGDCLRLVMAIALQPNVKDFGDQLLHRLMEEMKDFAGDLFKNMTPEQEEQFIRELTPVERARFEEFRKEKNAKVDSEAKKRWGEL